MRVALDMAGIHAVAVATVGGAVELSLEHAAGERGVAYPRSLLERVA